MKSVLVIGGNSDIGFAIAKVFAKNNYDINLASRNIEGLENKKKILEENYKSKCHITNFDVLDHAKFEEFFEKNSICPEVLVVACGYLEIEERNFSKIIHTNYLSPLIFIEKFLKFYENQKKNYTIIGISSVAGERGKKKNSIYSSSKSAFSSYLDGLRQRLYLKKINVMTVKPGWVGTKMIKNHKIPKFMITNVDNIGKEIFKGFLKKKNILYVPSYWRIIMFVYKLVPEFIFKILIKKKI